MRKVQSFDEIILGPSAKRIEAEMQQSQREFEQRQKAVWSRLVPQIAFVRLRCDAKRRRASIYEIADEALATYPTDFSTGYGGRGVPDHSLVLLTLIEASKREWGVHCWRLVSRMAANQKGHRFRQGRGAKKGVKEAVNANSRYGTERSKTGVWSPALAACYREGFDARGPQRPGCLSRIPVLNGSLDRIFSPLADRVGNSYNLREHHCSERPVVPSRVLPCGIPGVS